MKHYEIFFEFFGRNMRTTVLAQDEEQARNIVKNRINFVEIRDKYKEVKKPKMVDDEKLDELMGLFGMK